MRTILGSDPKIDTILDQIFDLLTQKNTLATE